MSSPELVEHLKQSYNYYNNLPSLEEADNAFNDRDKVFQDLISNHRNVYATHDKFVVTLMHRHFKLAPGEILVTRGDVTQPEFHEASQNVFPSAWLANGQPFEFSVDPPPAGLSSYLPKLLQPLENSSGIARFGGMPILGLRYVPEGYEENMIDLEVTHEGRRSITRRIPADEVGEGVIVTSCWFLGNDEECETCKCKQDTILHTKVCIPDPDSE